MRTTLGRRLREKREANSLSQQSLANLSGVAKNTIIAIEKGQIESPHPYTIKRLIGALNITRADLFGPHEPRPANHESPLVTVPRYKALNDPVARLLWIRSNCEVLQRDPPELTHFISYDSIVTEFSWLRLPEYIQTTTLEYGALWGNRSRYIPYEASLLFFERAGRTLERLFVIDPGRLREFGYIQGIRRVFLRHEALKLKPRFLLNHEAQQMNGELHARCDAVLVFDSKDVWILPKDEQSDPVFLRTANRPFCINASNVLLARWKQALTAETLLLRHPPTKEDRNAVDEDLELIEETIDLMRH